MAKLSPDEVQFVQGVSTQVGLDPRVLIAWVEQEGALAPGGTGGHNYLNLRPYQGDPYSSVSSGGFEQFASVNDAITATVRRLRQPFAAPIVSSAQRSPAQEIAAIASTGWDASHYGGPGGPNLQRTFNGLFPGQISSPWHPPPRTGMDAASVGIDVHNIGTPWGAAAAASHIPGVVQVEGAVHALRSVGDLIRFITSWRFAEIVGGILLLVVGLVLIGRHFGISPPLPANVANVATKTESTARTQAIFSDEVGPTETAHAAAQPTSRPRKTKMVSRPLPADRAAAQRKKPRAAAVDYGEVPF